MANQLYTKSYFIKRLIESGFFVQKLIDRYSPGDSRYWTIIANPNTSALLITCVKEEDQFYFKVIGPNHSQTKIQTKSMVIIIDILKGMNQHVESINNITNEEASYHTP